MDSGRGKFRAGSKRSVQSRDEALAPETPTQALETSKKRRIAPDCPLLDLPEGVLEQALLFHGNPRDLCSLAQSCTRLRRLVDGAEDFWETAFARRWGSPTAIQRRGAALAGSWKGLFASRAASEREHAPWQRPSEHEIRAAVESLAQSRKQRETCIVFLIDGSGSVTEDDFSCMTAFVTRVVSQVAGEEEPGAAGLGPGAAGNYEAVEDGGEASEDEVPRSEAGPAPEAAALRAPGPRCQVAVLQFSNDCRLEIPPSPVDPPRISRLLDGMYRMNGGTNISLAIQRAGQLLKPLSPDARRVLVLLTDGRIDSHQAREAREMARRLADEQRHVSLHAFGVGRGVDRGELLRIVGATRPETAEARYLGLCTLDEAPW